jgi:3-hydroxybutyryl-CoA dehydratase
MFQGKWYDEVAAGERFGTRVTVTETHLVLGSGMFGDFNPLHVDEEFSKQSMFGTRVLHGPFTGALIAAPVGNYFAGTALAYLEYACRFKAPVRPGDTIATEWTVTERIDKPKHKGGILVMRCEGRNQKDEIAVEAEAKLLVASRPSP